MGRVASSTAAAGLSPRVRGNRMDRGGYNVIKRSIPAGAGEPPPTPSTGMRMSVYPRGCGGTAMPRFSISFRNGLSPRVRGNRSDAPRSSNTSGSIPAGAGEPGPLRPWGGPPAVYPRGCGGTYSIGDLDTQLYGLSPRVRGNPAPGAGMVGHRGSIPAGAGEPGPRDSASAPTTVYPRGCGGTTAPGPCRTPHAGLSPRVRGNPPRPAGAVVGTRSIPAGAGEPSMRAGMVVPTRVYPRGCGGTHR